MTFRFSTRDLSKRFITLKKKNQPSAISDETLFLLPNDLIISQKKDMRV